jgi:hypothetical protein
VWLSFLAAAGCGRLSDPDLATGQVAGRIAGAQAGAYAYVLGSPDRKAALAADGSFAIDRVAAGPQQIVLWDGAAHAELARVEVSGGDRARLPDRVAAAMPLAGRIVAAVRPAGGASSAGVRFTVVGTDQRDVAGVPVGLGEGAVLGPLPAGAWQVVAVLGGFKQLAPLAVSVSEGLSAPADLNLDVQDGGTPRGCQVTSCGNGLQCDPATGTCVACWQDGHCVGGNTCDLATHTCVEGLPGGGALCESAAAATYCARGRLVSTGPGLGYCSQACTLSTECPAGWACAGGVCAVASTCLAATATFGVACAQNDACRDPRGGLVGGTCVRSDDDHPGFCSAPCAGEQSCLDAGFGHCLLRSPSSSARYCQRLACSAPDDCLELGGRCVQGFCQP